MPWGRPPIRTSRCASFTASWSTGDAPRAPTTRWRRCGPMRICGPVLAAVLGASTAARRRHRGEPWALGCAGRNLRRLRPVRRCGHGLAGRAEVGVPGRFVAHRGGGSDPHRRRGEDDGPPVAPGGCHVGRGAAHRRVGARSPSTPRGHRHGQVRRAGAELCQRCRRHLRRGERRRPRRWAGGRRPSDADLWRRGVARRCEPPAGGQSGAAGAHARVPSGLLQAVGPDLGVPGAVEGPTGRGRPGVGGGVARLAAAARVAGRRTSRGGRRRAGDAPPHHRKRSGGANGNAKSSVVRVGCGTSSSRCSCCSWCTGAETTHCAHHLRWTHSAR